MKEQAVIGVEATVEAIAEYAGIAKGTVYLYFRICLLRSCVFAMTT